MNHICIRYIFVTLLIFCGLTPFISEAANVNVKLDVFVCNNNNICEEEIGENNWSCPLDCPAPTSTPTTTSPVVTQTSEAQFVYSGSAVHQTTIKPADKGTTTTNAILGPIIVAPISDSALITWKTRLPSLMTFSWGKTAEYEIGATAESWFHTNFKVSLDNLQPGRQYYYKFTLKDTLGVEKSYEGSFMTLPFQLSSPVPPDEFKATLSNSGVLFQWTNSKSETFSYVRLVKSAFGYPKSPLDGKVVYEGTNTYARDTALTNGAGYYYSLFAFDAQDRHSSPAILYLTYDASKFSGSTTDSEPLTKHDDSKFTTIYPVLKDPYKLCGSMDKVINDRIANIPVSTSSAAIGQAGITFTQNGVPVERDGNGKLQLTAAPLVVQIRASTYGIDSQNPVAFCLSGGVEQAQKAYLFSLNQKTGFYEAVVPFFAHSVDSDFYVGMLKYGYEEQILTRGELSLHAGKNSEYSSATSTPFRKFITNVFGDERSVFVLITGGILTIFRFLLNLFKT